MPNTKSVGVAFSDPELVAGTTITGATISGGSISDATLVSAANIVSTSGIYVNGLFLTTSTVAAAGTNQATAAALGNGFTLVSGADGTKGVILPGAVAGRTVIVKNNTAATLKIYPAASDAINALAANASYDIGNLTATILIAYDATTWYSVPLVAS